MLVGAEGLGVAEPLDVTSCRSVALTSELIPPEPRQVGLPSDDPGAEVRGTRIRRINRLSSCVHNHLVKKDLGRKEEELGDCSDGRKGAKQLLRLLYLDSLTKDYDGTAKDYLTWRLMWQTLRRSRGCGAFVTSYRELVTIV